MKPGRNDPCACGSGNKLKKCCGRGPTGSNAGPLLAATAAPATPARAGALPSAIARLAALLNAGRYGDAGDLARALADLHPTHAVAWKALGLSQLMQGQDARQALTRAAHLSPSDAEAHGNLGKALQDRGQLVEAVVSYRRTLEIAPDVSAVHNNLGLALHGLGRFDEAAASYERALDITPGLASTYSDLGNALRELGRLDEAVSNYRRALSLNPNYAEAHNNLGLALRDLGHLEEAVASCRRALEITPTLVEAHTNVGHALRDLGRFEQAGAAFGHALALRPSSAEAHLHLAWVRRLQGRTREAEAGCRRALDLDRDHAQAHAFMGELHADNGRFLDAETCFRRALLTAPELPEAWVGIARYRPMGADDAGWLTAVKALVGKPLAPPQEIPLRYAMGKYFDDLQDFEQAFGQYRRANELSKLHRTPYERAHMTRFADHVAAVSARVPARVPQTGPDEVARPVFIVGMPRAGTSLVEQILASHPSVFGAGELSFWNDAWAQHASAQDAMAGSSTAQLAADYLRLLETLSPDATRVVDKMPANFLNLGLIHASLPNARIIHVRRNPIDTCLSIYFQNFAGTHSYAVDLDDLTHYYGEYLRIMREWRSVLPTRSLLEISYEELVEEPEVWSRGMLDFIGLPWDPRCLDFHRTERTVTTSSKWQVKQKIHQTSAGRWRKYEPFLGPLRTLLEREQ